MTTKNSRTKTRKRVGDPIRKAQNQNTILRLKDANQRYLAEKKLQKKKSKLSTRQIMEREKRIRDEFFKTALDGFDTRPFLATWDETSSAACNEVLELASKSLAVIDGFELANRAITGPLNMQEAGVEIKIVLDYARRASKISFFEVVLKNSGLSEQWRTLMMQYFIAKEMGMVAEGFGSKLAEAIKEAAGRPAEGPFPLNEKATNSFVPKPARKSVSEVGRERARAYYAKISGKN